MIKIGESLWRRINEYLLELSSCRTREQLTRYAVASIQSVIPCDVACGLFDMRSLKLIAGGQGLSESANKAYNDYYCYRMPWMTVDSDPHHPPIIESPFDVMRLKWSSFPSSEIYTDFARPNGMAYALADSQAKNLSLSLQRSRLGPAFSDCECLVTRIVDSHLNNLLDLIDLIERGTPPEPAEVAALFPTLSFREAEVLSLVIWGLPASVVASKLFISRRTVEAHLRSIYGKLDVHTKTQAIALVNARRGDK